MVSCDRVLCRLIKVRDQIYVYWLQPALLSIVVDLVRVATDDLASGKAEIWIYLECCASTMTTGDTSTLVGSIHSSLK